MNEASLTTEFRNFMLKQTKKIDMTFVCEFKVVKKGNFKFSQVKKHQIEELESLSNIGSSFIYKISDAFGSSNGKTFHAQGKPDMLYLYEPAVYVGIIYWVPRKKKVAYLIDINRLINLRSASRVITEGRIKGACDWEVDLKSKKIYKHTINGIIEV